jgi:DNA-binding PadR family transcriptional regulator
MKLRPASYLVLGMVRLGARSGYAIKKAADISTRVFFPISLAQVYPELAGLETGGLVTRRDNARGGRARSAHHLTDDGERALLAWLRSERLGPVQLRDDGLLRLFLADALPLDEQIALVRRMSERARAAERWMQSDALPAARAQEGAGYRHPHTVARLGADTYTFHAEWLERLAGELEADLEAGTRPGRRTRRPVA